CPYTPTTECGYSNATGINERGQIAGWSTATDGSLHAVLWENGTIRDLWKAPDASLGNLWDYWAWSFLAVINDEGQVAGSRLGDAFFWSGGSVWSLGSLGG